VSQKTTYPELYLIRHAATAWSESGQHTGLTDLPLTDKGLKQAELLGRRLKHEGFSAVYCSPLQRAVETCSICGFKPNIDPHLVEWNYGKYEGLTTEQIEEKKPGWNIFKDGAPGGETPAQVVQRAQEFLKKLESRQGKIAIFSSAHFSRVLATQWLKVPIDFGNVLYLSAASISILGYEHTQRAIICWNDISHLSIS
jgi:broad specificity phosphatase PhoE